MMTANPPSADYHRGDVRPRGAQNRVYYDTTHNSLLATEYDRHLTLSSLAVVDTNRGILAPVRRRSYRQRASHSIC
jgi:hypothetical protein